MSRKAVVIGCDYPATVSAELKGSVNDAHLNAELLTQKFGFPRESVVFLTDRDRKTGGPIDINTGRTPTKDKILRAASWLVTGSKPGDILFFSFSGIGSIVPDATSKDRTMLEVICPAGFEHRDGSFPYTLVSMRDLMTVFAEKDPQAQLICFFDCNYGATVLGPSHCRVTTSNGSHITVNSIGNPTEFAAERRSPSVWLDNDAPCRPRFLPPLTVPFTPGAFGQLKMIPDKSNIFVFSASEDHNAALEAAFSPERRDTLGLCTWALHKALADLGYDQSTTVEVLLQRMNSCLRLLKSDPALQHSDQWISLSFPRGCDPAKARVLSHAPSQHPLVSGVGSNYTSTVGAHTMKDNVINMQQQQHQQQQYQQQQQQQNYNHGQDNSYHHQQQQQQQQPNSTYTHSQQASQSSFYPPQQQQQQQGALPGGLSPEQMHQMFLEQQRQIQALQEQLRMQQAPPAR